MQIGKVTVLDVNLDVSIRDLYSEIKIFPFKLEEVIKNISCSWGLLKI